MTSGRSQRRAAERALAKQRHQENVARYNSAAIDELSARGLTSWATDHQLRVICSFNARPDADNWYPSQSAIAGRGGYTRRTSIRRMKRAIEQGVLIVEKRVAKPSLDARPRPKNHTTNVYRLNRAALGLGPRPERNAPPASSSSSPATSTPAPAIERAPSALAHSIHTELLAHVELSTFATRAYAEKFADMAAAEGRDADAAMLAIRSVARDVELGAEHAKIDPQARWTPDRIFNSIAKRVRTQFMKRPNAPPAPAPVATPEPAEAPSDMDREEYRRIAAEARAKVEALGKGRAPP